MTRKVSIFLGGTGANNAADALSNLGAANVAAYAQANTARDQANAAYAQANTASSSGTAAYDQANTARGQANTARTTANDAYGQANTAYGQANAAYAAANNAQVTVYANSASAVTTQKINFVNTATITVAVTNSDGNANIAFTAVGGAAYDQANAAYGQANSARDQANTARTQANNAYAEANLKLNIAGGTINGSLNVSGNLAVTGNTTYYNVTTYSVDDPLIYLAANNYTSDLVDIGFMGGHNTSGVYQHSGLARDAGDGTWYLFTGLLEEGHENNVIDFANTSLATLRANINANSILLTGNAVATQANLTLAYNQANNARDQANAAYAEANLKVNLSGGTFTGDVTFNANVKFAANSTISTNTVATVTQDVEVTVDAFATATFRSAVYQAQLTRTSPANDYETITLSVVHDGSTVYLSQYGQNKTNASANMGTFDATIATGTLSLKFKPNVDVVTVKTHRNAITV